MCVFFYETLQALQLVGMRKGQIKGEAISALDKEKHRRCMRQGNTNLFTAVTQPTYSKHNTGGQMCEPKNRRAKKGERREKTGSKFTQILCGKERRVSKTGFTCLLQGAGGLKNSKNVPVRTEERRTNPGVRARVKINATADIHVLERSNPIIGFRAGPNRFIKSPTRGC